MQFSRETLSARFWELEDAKAAVEARVAPLKAERAEILDRIKPELDREREIGKQIRAIEAEAGLVEIDEERAFLSRGLGGKVGPRP